VSAEIERKFLLPEVPDWLSGQPAAKIEQGYLAISEEIEIRLRSLDEERLLTAKRGHGEVREEVEVELDSRQFDALWPLTESMRLQKARFRVPVGKLTAEVDVYEGPLRGLVTAEVEFPSREQADAFEPPDWLGEEVTGDDRYSNQALVRSGMPEKPANSESQAA
jgi:adenylate cyclase